MFNQTKNIFIVTLITFLVQGCWYQSKKKVVQDLNSSEVQFTPPPGTYSQALDIAMKLASSKLKSVSIQIKNANGSWERYQSPIHLESSAVLRYRLVYISDMRAESDEKTAEYVITPN